MRAHEFVQPVPDQRPLDLQQPGENSRAHQARPLRALLEPHQARLDPVDASRTLVDAAQELLHFGFRDQVAAFLLQVFGDVLAGGAPRAPRPGPHALGKQGQMPRRHVAHAARQLLFQVRPRRCEQLAIQIGDLGIAANLHRDAVSARSAAAP